MTQKDLLRELKNTIKELTDEKDDLLTKLKSKEKLIWGAILASKILPNTLQKST